VTSQAICLIASGTFASWRKAKHGRIMTRFRVMAANEHHTASADTAESRRYNRIKRWMGVGDFAIGLGLLIVLLGTGWSATLRDVAYRPHGRTIRSRVSFMF